MALVAALLIVGTILILIEFILPGMIAGILGCVCLIVAIVIGYTRFGATTGNLILIGVVFGLLVTAVLWLRYFPHSRAGRLFVSEGRVGSAGYDFQNLVDQSGETQSPLAPSGVAVIGGRRCDVVSEGGFVEAGTPVKVVLVEGNRIVVRPVSS